MSISPLTADVEQLVPVILARASYEKRRIAGDGEDDDARDYTPAVTVALEGITKIRQGSNCGPWVCCRVLTSIQRSRKVIRVFGWRSFSPV